MENFIPFITCCLCHSFLLKGRTRHTFFPCSIVGSLSRETVFHELLQCQVPPIWCSFLQTASVWVLSTWFTPPGTGSLCMGPQGTCFSISSSLHGATGPTQSLLQHGLSMGSQPPLGTSNCSDVHSSRGCR